MSPKLKMGRSKKAAKPAKRKPGRPKKAKKAAKRKPGRPKKSGKKAAKKTARKRAGGKRRTYSATRKASLLKKYQELKASGMTAQVAAKKVGVSYITLRSWEKKGAGGAAANPRKVRKAGRPRKATKKKAGRPRKAGRKAKAAPKARGHMVLVTPDGNRIEGISTNDLIKVLKALK